jgi:hypothetical protein
MDSAKHTHTHTHTHKVNSINLLMSQRNNIEVNSNIGRPTTCK